MTATLPVAQIPRPSMPMLLGVLVVGLQVGTGGAATFEYVNERGSRGYALARCELRPVSLGARDAATAAENLAQIRAVLHPSVTDLAKSLGVSRQAVYDWQAGKPIAPENADRLADLARAADMLAVEGLTANARLLRRPISGGKNIFEIVNDGGSAVAAARNLIDTVRREVQQRQRLQARLQGRPRASREAFERLGSPMLDENG